MPFPEPPALHQTTCTPTDRQHTMAPIPHRGFAPGAFVPLQSSTTFCQTSNLRRDKIRGTVIEADKNQRARRQEEKMVLMEE